MDELDKIAETNKAENKAEKIHAVNRAQWDDLEHTCLLLNVVNNATGEQFTYAARESDPAPLNRELWAAAMENEDAILPTEVELILSGKKETPSGKTLIGTTLFDDEAQKILVKRQATVMLAALTAPVAAVRAEIDPVFRALRLENMKLLLAVEDQPGFPYDVTWPEEIV